MFVILFVVVPICAILWILRRWVRIKNFWAEKGVQHIQPLPVLGSMTFLQKQNPAIWMRDMYDHFRSPYVGVWLFWRPALIINSPEIARRVLVKDAAVFRDRFLRSGKKDTIGSLTLFVAKGSLWSFMRRRLTAVFTASKLRNLQQLFTSKSKELVQRIRMEMEKEKRVNLRMMFTDYTTDVIGTASFGVSSDATLTRESALRTVTKDFMKFSFFRGLSWSSVFFFPELVDIFGFTVFPKDATDYFTKVYKAIVAQRGGYNTDPSESKDLLDALRKIKQDCGKNNEDISEDTLIAQGAVFLQAGFDTTGSALAFCAYELAFLPHVQEKLYAELKEANLCNGNADYVAGTVNELKYLNCVMKETLRKYPPMGWLDRVAAADYEVDEKLSISAGTPVYVNAVGMHYDPEYFPDPNKFEPERFLPENEKNIKPFTYLPFGEGPRSCIGRRFAIQNFNTALAYTILHYKVIPKPNTPLPSEVPIEKKGLLYVPGEDMYVDFVPRK